MGGSRNAEGIRPRRHNVALGLVAGACLLSSALAPWSADARDGSRHKDGKTVYKKICSFCHEDGLLGSPLFADPNVWRPRQAKGRRVLYENTLRGKGHMSPRIDREGYTESDIKAAVDYLIERSRRGR